MESYANRAVSAKTVYPPWALFGWYGNPRFNVVLRMYNATPTLSRG